MTILLDRGKTTPEDLKLTLSTRKVRADGPLVSIAYFPNEAEARMAACRLQSDGIFVLVRDKLPRYGFGPPSATLSVPIDEIARAIEILKKTPARRRLLGNQKSRGAGNGEAAGQP